MIKEFISKLWEKELKDYKFNSYGYSSSKINDGFYLILSKYTINKLENYAISKYKKGLKTDVKEKTNDNINHYKQKSMVCLMINTLNIQVIEVKIHQLNYILKSLDHMWVIW